MWSVLSKIFTKNLSIEEHQTCEQPPDEMDRGERKNHSETDDTYISKQAKQRASMKWLLSKAYNNKVPENIKEPFYKDHENQEHVKPQIVSGLANAEIYCRALANIYSDPNYHNLNHTAILQTLTRKGVTVTEPLDGSQMTETTLIQTNPLRMGAHMAVIESVMLLYAREVVTSDRVTAAIQRFSHGRAVGISTPFSHEEGVLLWIQHACHALKQRVIQEIVALVEKGGEGDRLKPPDFPQYRNLKDLCDGVGLAAIVAYYCPDEFHWTNIRLSLVHSVQDSLHNLRLVKEFCLRCLQASIFHLQLTDVTYYQESMKLNLMVFLADLFNVMEIHPVSCVRDKFSNAEDFPKRNAHGVVHKRNLLQPVLTSIPDLRSSLDESPTANAFQVLPSHVTQRKTDSLYQSQQTLASEFSEDSLKRGPDESFVVHKGRNIPTLRSVVSEEPLIPAKYKISKEKQNYDSKADERGDIAAGRPSNWEESRKSTYAGRRSRKNSITDESQLTIENFGGSQDNLNFIGKHLDNEININSGRKISAPSFPVPVENAPVRSSLKDSKASFQLGYDDGCEEKQDNGSEKNRLKRQMSSDDITLRSYHDKENLFMDLVDSEIINRISFADLSKPKSIGETKGIQLVYMSDRAETPSNSSLISRLENTNSNNTEKKTSFSARPNQTTWQHQVSSVPLPENYINGVNMGTACNIMNSQLNDIRLKLEEKRRHIESEKRRMEVAMNKQRQKLGKAAFLQAVVKGRGNLLKSPENNAFGSSKDSTDQGHVSHPNQPRPMTLQEVSDDATHVEKKWLNDNDSVVETSNTIDLENMDLEQYQRTLAQMNSSLSDIQVDIQRLAAEQSQIQVQHQQTMIAEQQQQVLNIQQQLQRQQSQPLETRFYDSQKYQHAQSYASPLQSSSSSPHIPHYNTRVPEEPQFFLHDNSKVPTVPTYRKTWGQPSIQPNHMSTNMYTSHLPELNFWGKSPPVEHYSNNKHGFVLNHVGSDGYADYQEKHKDSPGTPENRYQNTASQRHYNQNNATSQRTPSASPRHSGNVHRQISQLLDEAIATKRQAPVVSQSPVDSESSIRMGEKQAGVIHAPVSAPSVDDMEPQNISFIGSSNEDAVLSQSLSRLHITSGSRTYRIPSPTRSVHSRASPFLPLSSSPSVAESLPHSQASSLDRNPSAEKGFYISFDNDDQPKRPKPALRSKRGSPKNERSYVKSDNDASEKADAEERLNKRKLDKQLLEEKLREEEAKRREFLIQKEREKFRTKHEDSQQSIHQVPTTSAIIIGNELSNPDPDLVDEREKKKEKIMELSLQRKQQLKEAKAKKEAEAQYKKEIEKAKKEEKARKKEEQAARRTAILEQYKLKKAIEEAERDGTTLDRQDLLSQKPTPKLRLKGPTRPRPKTIHIDSGSVQLAERLSSGEREGSLSNLTAPSAMKRDYYRGSQDSLADRSLGNNMLYKVSPDESYGRSPSHSTNQTLGRRSSYKTSRDPSPGPGQTRGRTKISTYQNLKGRKSNSLMNLYGSSTDQESLPYRFGDTDSGLGRATPPRRAPSPGMGLRHLPSPSGPGSLPGLMSKSRRVFDDGSSDISSTPSSMMDYNGPRLYKQPATKSNRGILLNAVEYCVFPGVVNREAKRRVLEEINKSESKHFLILFRDAGCQFRALYSYCPDSELVTKLYGTGPKQVNDKMFDTFFKYNSGGKCFSLVHTKHLTVTIDAFTIHNSLWQGKKVNLPSKKDMALVI